MTTQRAEKYLGTESAFDQHLEKLVKIPLLTSEQEVDFAHQVQKREQLLALRESLVLENAEPTKQSWAEAANLDIAGLDRTLAIGLRAKQKMIEGNLRLVIHVAKKYQNRGLEISDLVQEGTLGLNRAAEKFQPAKGYKFSTYAFNWIQQGITRAIANHARTIRLPIHINQKLQTLKKCRALLIIELKRYLTAKEVADASGIALEKIEELASHVRPIRSLNGKFGKEEEVELVDVIPGQEEMPEEVAIQREKSEALQQMFVCLSPTEKQILVLRFGLDGNEPMSRSEVGEFLGIGKKEAYKVERQGLYKLKRTSAASKF
jgi:RNA polymerase nonessential primary-like sigma factor